MENSEAEPTVAGWRLKNSYALLPASLYTFVEPTPVPEPRLLVFNRDLAVSLGLEAAALDTPAGAALLAGNALAPGSRPLAQAYAGHQFGHFTILGDGRAHLLGEQLAPDGRRYDLQLKGSGRTPYSRGGDGRAAVGPMLREYLISEAMAALGIPSTRSLAVTATGETVYREQALPGAVLARVAASHIRVGTFEWAAAQGDTEPLRALADYTIDRHYPELATQPDRHRALLEATLERQAALIARWMLAGFVHGVMNTDNMALSGETIDYGPCAFIDTYDPSTVFSSIDRNGRYAYRNQPAIALWNLTRLAEALLPLIDPTADRAVEMANATLARFQSRYQAHWIAGMRAKLGLFSEQADDGPLAFALLDWMQEHKQDFANMFRSLSAPEAQVAAPFADSAFRDWHARWQARLARQDEGPDAVSTRMQASNPAVIPRNHKVEEALTAAQERGDLEPFRQLLAVLARPFDHAQCDPDYVDPPPPDAAPYRTFCGT